MKMRVWALSLLAGTPALPMAGPPPAANSAFDSYVRIVESRLADQHRSSHSFLARTGNPPPNGDPFIERLASPFEAELPGAMLHHWRGTAFAPRAKATDLEQVLQNFEAYPQRFAPQVLQARASVGENNRMQAWMRVRQQHVITVVMDASYDVSFGWLDAQHGFSTSRSTRISEIDSPGTPAERTLSDREEHGFLWRLNTYWSYEERDGGLYLQIEAVSLTRSIPRGLGWVIRPWVERVPRESLEFTLRSARNAVMKSQF